MPRQSRGRPAARPSAPAPAPQQSRGAHTAAYPPTQTYGHPPATAQAGAQKQPGMIAQMAATAGSVAVGSTIGHGLSNMLFGGRSAEAAPAQEQPVQQRQENQNVKACDFQAKEFTKCLEVADVQSCSWYLDQLKACQQAAAPY